MGYTSSAIPRVNQQLRCGYLGNFGFSLSSKPAAVLSTPTPPALNPASNTSVASPWELHWFW